MFSNLPSGAFAFANAEFILSKETPKDKATAIALRVL